MIGIVKGNDLILRATGWSEAEDFVWKCSKVNLNWWAGNPYFNIEAAYTCPAESECEDISSFSLWKESHDDICPVFVQGTPLGANHGFNCVDRVTAPSHGKTEADIGSVWLDSGDRTFCLVNVPDPHTLWFVLFDDKSMTHGKMSFGVPSGKLVHGFGATHTEDVTIEARSNTQLWQSFNHYSMKFLVDGEVRDIKGDSVFDGDKFEIETQYDIIYVPAMLRHLMHNTGNNTNESQHSEEIEESYLRVNVKYEFRENGSVTTYCSFWINKELELGYIGLVQSMAVDSTTYTYVPDTSYKNLTVQGSSSIHFFSRDTWDSEEKAPYRYYQFADVSCGKGMALAYDRRFGWGTNEKRVRCLEHAGRYYTTRKMYPAFISGGKLSAGEHVDGIAVRMPLYRYDEDMTAVCWYWIGDEIVLMIDIHSAVSKEIRLPEYMNDRKIEILDKTESVKIGQSAINSAKLKVHSDGYGYVVIRLH